MGPANGAAMFKQLGPEFSGTLLLQLGSLFSAQMLVAPGHLAVAQLMQEMGPPFSAAMFRVTGKDSCDCSCDSAVTCSGSAGMFMRTLFVRLQQWHDASSLDAAQSLGRKGLAGPRGYFG
jgi:hypothetical protein